MAAARSTDELCSAMRGAMAKPRSAVGESASAGNPGSPHEAGSSPDAAFDSQAVPHALAFEHRRTSKAKTEIATTAGKKPKPQELKRRRKARPPFGAALRRDMPACEILPEPRTREGEPHEQNSAQPGAATGAFGATRPKTRAGRPRCCGKIRRDAPMRRLGIPFRPRAEGVRLVRQSEHGTGRGSMQSGRSQTALRPTITPEHEKSRA